MTFEEMQYAEDITAIAEHTRLYSEYYRIGLDRKTAMLTAVKKLFPAEYSNAVAWETRQGINALQYLTEQGIPLIGVYQSGAMIAEQKPESFTTDPAEILSLAEGRGDKNGRARGTPIERFYFIPKDAGLLCLDIDRKNGKDGIAEFYAWAERNGKPRHLLPRFLQDIPNNFPCYVSTPSNGYHLYFRYTGSLIPKKPLAPNTPGVEVKHGKPGLTAPGSYKNGQPYTLHGSLENTPDLPAFLLAGFKIPAPARAVYLPAQKKDWGKPSWEKITEWTEKDGAGAGRNDRAFNLARHARDHGYTETETLEAIRFDSGLDGLPEKEILSAVRSAFKGV